MLTVTVNLVSSCGVEPTRGLITYKCIEFNITGRFLITVVIHETSVKLRVVAEEVVVASLNTRVLFKHFIGRNEANLESKIVWA
jgi:hypothetical protein